MDNNQEKLVYLYRHGETDWNVLGKTMGQLEGINTEFTDLGYNQINYISKKLEDDKIEAIYTSDCKRTVETARIANTKKIPIFVVKEIRGLNMGIYQGLSMDELKDSEDVKLSFTDYHIPLLNGESINDLNKRILDFIKKICKETNYKKIALITHSAVISNLKAYLMNDKYISLNMCLLLYKDDNISVLDYTHANSDSKNKVLIKEIKDNYEIK